MSSLSRRLPQPPWCPPYQPLRVPPYSPPLFRNLPLGYVRCLRRPAMQWVCRKCLCCHAEVPVEALPWSLWQEGAAVFTLTLAHAIRSLTPGVSAFTGFAGRYELQTGLIMGSVSVLINLLTGPSVRITCRTCTKTSCSSFALTFLPPNGWATVLDDNGPPAIAQASRVRSDIGDRNLHQKITPITPTHAPLSATLPHHHS